MVLNFDDDSARRGVEMFYRTQKTLINPIIDWEDDDVWEFLDNIAKVPHCCLYDEGRTRIGCIGCPMQGGEGMKADFERFPTYRRAYVRAFDKMLKNYRDKIRQKNWRTGEDVLNWWINTKGS